MDASHEALNIGEQQQSNVDSGLTDKTIRHYPTVTDGDVIEINLNFRNSSICRFPNRQSGITLWDSGATYSLISEGSINNNAYLKNIKPTSTPSMKFMVGNGNFIVSTKTLTFNMAINGNIFQLTAYIVPTLGGISVIVGTKSLKELEAELHFKHNVLKFRKREVIAKLSRNAIIKPGDTRILSMRGKLPDVLKSSEVYFQASKFLSQFVPSLMLVKMTKGVTRIAVHNSTTKTVKIRCDKPIGTFLLKNFGSVPTDQVLQFKECNGPDSEVYAVSAVQNGTDKLDRKSIYLDKINRFPFLDKDDARLTMTDEEVLRKDIDLTQHCMSESTFKKFWNLLDERKAAFSIHGEVGECPDLSVKIKLNDESPFFIRPYPVSEREKEVIDKEMSKLIKMGILTYGKSSYVSPILLLKKKNNPSNPYRLVSDFRVLNSKVVPLHYCTPLLKDALQIIGNSDAKVFSTIDIKNAFYSLRVHPESQKYLTIAPYSSGRTLQYLRLPQGLSISPTEWNDKIADILSEIPKHTQFCLGIADDVIIYSKDECDHLNHIETLLKLFEKHGLKLSVNKCQFFRKSLDYMGHKIKITNGRPSITPQKSKVEAIEKLQPPKTPKQTKSLIGMIAYLSMYIPRLQLLLTPMHKLTRKGVKFEWTKEMADNFKEIKEILKKHPVLTLPAKEGLFRLYCDTSFIGTGASLCQVQDGEERILAYYSKKLPESARRYTPSELEGTGMYMCVQAFRHLLRNVPFEIITDHSALINISRSKNEPPTLRLKKIFERLSAFKFHLKYMQGKKMVISDFFSRHPSCEVDDNDPIAFSQKHQDEEDEEDALLHAITTRSRARSSGEELLKGLPTSSKGRMADLPSAINAPSSVLPPAYIPRDVDTEVLTTRSGSTDIQLRPNSDSRPLHIANKQQEYLPVSNRTSESDRRFFRPNQIEITVPKQVEHTVREQPDSTVEQPTRLTDMYPRQQREVIFRERLIEPPQKIVETHTQPEDYMFARPKKIFEDKDDVDIFHKNIPKQDLIERMLKTLSKKIITDSYLPVSKASLAKQQAADPYLKPIYNWLKYNHLPERARAQRKLKLLAEDFIMADDIMFRVRIDETGPEPAIHKALCIPEGLEPMIFYMAHESLYSNHMGITKTYLTMRKQYYINGLFNKLTHYIRACHQCQTQKTAQDTERPYEIRIPVSYRPFQRLYADIKYMPMSSSGNSYLLVITCEITRYCVIVALKRTDAQTVAEALLRKVILVHGEPQSIVVDEDRGFNNQVLDFLWRAVRTKATTCSPYNHGSLLVERHIKSISNLISSNLRDTGRNWDTFCEAAVYAYNTHVIPRIGYSPFYLVHMRDPPPLTELKFSPLEDIKGNYRDYVAFLQKRLEHVGKSVLEMQAKLQSQQAAKHMEKVKKPNKFREGLIVYLNAPSASSLKTNTLKFRSDYVGPLYIRELLGHDKTILSSIDGKILHGVFHVNRLKPGFIRLDKGSATHIDEVRKAYNEKQVKEIPKTPDQEIKAAQKPAEEVPSPHTAAACNFQSIFSIQDIQEIGCFNNMPKNSIITSPPSDDDCIDQQIYLQYQKSNEHLGAPRELTPKERMKIITHGESLSKQGEELSITKIRFKNGHIQMCLQSDQTGPGHAFWYDPRYHPNNCEVIAKYLEQPTMRIHGSLRKLTGRTYVY